jgi:hypothetical protein
MSAPQDYAGMPIRNLLILSVMLSVGACAPIPTSERLSPRISGTVVDGEHHPIAGARVEYLYRGGPVLGETATSGDGRFTLGPFHQWFYLIYLGSPGVAPFPYSLKYPPYVPSVIRVSSGKNTGIYLLGTESKYLQEVSAEQRREIRLPSPRRWAGSPMQLELTKAMEDKTLPSKAR